MSGAVWGGHRGAKAFEAEPHRLTAAGQREWRAHLQRLDPAYQRFKLLVPGLVPPKRGRKPRAAGHSAEARE